MANLIVAVCGNVAAGKTTLMRAMVEHLPPFEPVEERPQDNPYLEDYYNNPMQPGLAFHVQMHFLLQKIDGLLSLKQRSGRFVVDRHIREDKEIFALMLHERGLINPRDWGTYERMYQSVARELPRPDLLVYLRADLPTIIARMEKRNRGAELDQPVRYWRDLNERYHSWIAAYDESPVLEIDANRYDIVGRKEDREAVMEILRTRIAEIEQGR